MHYSGSSRPVMLILDDIMALLPASLFFFSFGTTSFFPYITKNDPQSKILQLQKTGYRWKTANILDVQCVRVALYI
jgi:hypothetical protein